MIDKLLKLSDSLIDQAKPGEEIEVIAVADRGTDIRIFDGKVEQFTQATNQGLGVRVISDKRQGFAWAGTLDRDVAQMALDEARDNATFGSQDEHFGLAQPDGVTKVDLNLYNKDLVDFDTDRKIELALELERAAFAGEKRIRLVESADYADALSQAVVVNTAGIRTVGSDAGAYIAAAVIAGSDDDTQMGFGYSVGRDPEKLDVSEASDMAISRSTRLLGAVKPETMRTCVVLDPMVTSQFLTIIGSTLSAGMVLKGRSLFGERLGEQVASPLITLVDDPTNPLAYTACESDGEGLATRRNLLIEDGVLQTFVHNSYTGRRSNSASTGNAVRGYSSTPGAGAMALALTPGQLTQEQLFAEIGDGVLVQGVSGLHSGVNPVSGDFSTGAEGVRIRNGQLAEPLREFTIASTLQKMFLDVTHVGSDLEWLPSSAAGLSLAVSDVTIGGY